MKKKMLVVIPMTSEQKERLEEAAQGMEIIYEEISRISKEQVKEVNVILGNVPPAWLQEARNLEWIHLNSAGSDPYMVSGILEPHTLLTCSTGAYGKAVSEHMFAMLLAMQKKLHLYRDDQKQHIWSDHGEVTSITNSLILVLGAGDIGAHFAAMAHILGAYVIGMKRSPGVCPEAMDELRNMDDLETLLPKADVVASFLPSTEETRGMIDKQFLGRMKEGSLLLNGGRGDVVCTEDLCDALEQGHLAGAALDVTAPEPLPKDHRIWDIPNAFVTPHISGSYHLAETLENVVNIAVENVRRYAKGERLRNLVK